MARYGGVADPDRGGNVRPGESPGHIDAPLEPATRRDAQLQIKGTSGGVASTAGIPLNSPGGTKPGQDYLTTLALAARHS